MTGKIDRRAMIAGTSAALLTTSFSPPASAVLGISALLTTLNVAKPFIILAQLIEIGSDHSREKEQSSRLNDIASQIHDIARNQDQILAELADQRIFMRAELKRAFLDNDVREMIAISHSFRIALASDDSVRAQRLGALSGRMDELAAKFSTYGLAAVPAYVNAIALQNSLHYVQGSPPKVFMAINEAHKENLNVMFSGNGPESLAHAIAQNPLTKAEEMQRKEKNGVFDIPFDYPVVAALILWGKEPDDRKMFELSIGIPSEIGKDLEQARWLEWGYTYKGFKDGSPVFEEFYRNRKGFRSSNLPDQPRFIGIDNFAMSAFSEQIPALGGGRIKGHKTDYQYRTHLDGKGLPVFQEQSFLVMRAQLDAITRYYRGQYDPNYGPDITETLPRRQLTRKPTDAQAALHRMLESSIITIDKILIAEIERSSTPRKTSQTRPNDGLSPFLG